MTRKERVNEAFQAAYDDLEKQWPDTVEPGTLHAQVARDYPGMMSRIDHAENEANAAAVAYIEGVSGGVQAKITEWRDLWAEAIQMIKEARG